MATLTTLLAEKTSSDYQAEILADLADPAVVGGSGMPTTSWQVGSVPRTLIATQAEVDADFNTSIRLVAEGGFVSSATGDWLTLKAYEDFDITRDPAVQTIGIEKLTDTGGGPHVIAAGALILSDSVGHQYKNLTGGTLALSGTLDLRIYATATGAEYNVGTGSITTLVTALAGVTCSNPATWLTTPGTVAAPAQGQLAVTDGAGTGPHVIGSGTLTINNGAGQSYTNTTSVTVPAAGTASVAIQAVAVGLAYNVANNTITTVAAAPVAGLTVTNSASNWITTSGSDEQSDASLAEQCRDKWATQGVGWTASAIEYLAQQAATTTPVTRVRVTTNPGGVAGLVGVTIGSVVGIMSGTDVATVQAYFNDDRTTLTSTITVASCTALPVVLTGTIYVPAAYASTARTAAERNLTALSQNTQIGGDDSIGNVLPLEDIIAAIKAASYDADGNQTNTGSPLDIDLTAPVGDTAIGAAQVPSIDYSALVWTSV